MDIQVKKGRQVCPELDQALLPPVCRQPGAAPAICPGLQSGQLPAQAMLTEGNQQLVITQSSSEADQDRGTDCALCPAVRFPVG